MNTAVQQARLPRTIVLNGVRLLATTLVYTEVLQTRHEIGGEERCFWTMQWWADALPRPVVSHFVSKREAEKSRRRLLAGIW